MKQDSQIILLDCDTMQFDYSYLQPAFSSDEPLWTLLHENNITTSDFVDKIHQQIDEILLLREPTAVFLEAPLVYDGTLQQYRIGFILSPPCKQLQLIFTNITEQTSAFRRLERQAHFDELTGLMTRSAFCKTVDEMTKFKPLPEKQYAMVYFDIQRFKAVNDMFGMTAGDKLLVHISNAMKETLPPKSICCRIDSDRFVILLHCGKKQPEPFIERLFSEITNIDLPVEITCNAGIYIMTERRHLAEAMIDRAILAQTSIKGSYTKKCVRYTEDLRKEMLTEQEIVGSMAIALTEKQFVMYLQPQYNHSSGMLIGAEALVRWKHPDRGLVPPDVFIPIFERNGFITKLDLFIFESACAFQRHCIDHHLPLVPISTNFSRHDIFHLSIVEDLETIRKKYDVPVALMRVEITETAVVGNSQHVNDVISRLHDCGYIVEMDDFGSGYSSLNVLKDIDLDIIKLDMKFLSRQSESNRGGTILSSVVRMAKWLSLPVIAEGVETVPQADFLRSIGCDYIQGYLYSRPLPTEDFLVLLEHSKIGPTTPQMHLIETLNACDFWNPESMETLLFSNYVGGAAIFDYHDDLFEILRVNKKYMQELNMNHSEKDFVGHNPIEFLNEENRDIYLAAVKRAIDTGTEQECDTWRSLKSQCCGEEEICIRSYITMIGKSDNNYLFYSTIRNVTLEKRYVEGIQDTERRFMAASEQVNIYYWEYDVATKEMRPCFRCMRDLGLPAIVPNYPEPAIEMGIFPPDFADMYRDWHKQIEHGQKSLEAVIPLTKDRVPFIVRYTTEFDESGHPVKAYGSAAMVV